MQRIKVLCRPPLLPESSLDQAHAIERCALCVGGHCGRQRTRNVCVDVTMACVVKRVCFRLIHVRVSVPHDAICSQEPFKEDKGTKGTYYEIGISSQGSTNGLREPFGASHAKKKVKV